MPKFMPIDASRIAKCIVFAGLSITLMTILIGCSKEQPSNIQDIIDRSAEAYGGRAELMSIKSLLVEYDVTNIHVKQSFKASEPWDTSDEDRVYHIDFGNERFVYDRKAGFREGYYAAKYIFDGVRYFTTDEQEKTVVIDETESFNGAITNTTLLNSTLIIRKMLENPSQASYVTDVVLEEKEQHVIKFSLPDGPELRLFIDRNTHLITKAEHETANRLYVITYKDYKRKGGVYFPYETVSDLSIRGGASVSNPKQRFIVNLLDVGRPIDDDAIVLPPDYFELERSSVASKQTLEIGSGVYWVRHNFHNSLFVEFSDYLIMVGVLRGATDRIEEIRKHIPDKPVKYAVVTHHHEDHVGGSEDVLDADITMAVLSAHEEAVLNSLPAKKRANAKFLIVNKKMVFEDHTQRLELFDIGPTPHTEHFLLAYIPQDSLIFEADHFAVYGFARPQAGNINVEAFANEINLLDIDVLHIASAHGSRLATYAELMTASQNVTK